MSSHVAILGASDNPERYSYKALQSLQTHGHRTYPIHPTLTSIQGQAVVKSLEELKKSGVKIDTLTVYVRPEIFAALVEQVIQLAPRRIIFNPGSEATEHFAHLRSAKIEVVEACTLVLLATGQF